MTEIATLRCHAIDDDIATVTLDKLDLGAPEAGQIQVAIKACAVNFPDILMIQGKYQFKPPLPFAPGGEAAGDVVAVGPGVEEFAVGDAVIISVRYGGFAEAINVDIESVKPKPPAMSYAAAASYQTAYLTAWVALVSRGHLKAGETLLVHGATGGVGVSVTNVSPGARLGGRSGLWLRSEVFDEGDAEVIEPSVDGLQLL